MTQEDILRNPEEFDLSIETVGKGTLKSPMKGIQFVSEEDRIGLTTDVRRIQDFYNKGIAVPSLEAAGPRETIFHDPAWTRAGIVTCGGLCPGLNNVIKGLVRPESAIRIPTHHAQPRRGRFHPGRRRYHPRQLPRNAGSLCHGRHLDAPQHQRAVLHRR